MYIAEPCNFFHVQHQPKVSYLLRAVKSRQHELYKARTVIQEKGFPLKPQHEFPVPHRVDTACS